jgi:zinc transport system permease protein
MVLMALVIIVSIYLVGIILVEALLVIPAAISRNLTRRLRGMLWVSAGAAVGSTVGGLGLSYVLDLPSGATVVLILGGLFFVAALLGRGRHG